jgi:hypothetical protein
MKNERKKTTFNTFTDSDSPVDNYFNNKKRVVEPLERKEFVSAEMQLVMKRKRSVILTIATTCGIKEPSSWTRFNAFMKNSSVLKKELHAYNYDELDDLNRQFRALKINYEHSAEKLGSKDWHHARGLPISSTN